MTDINTLDEILDEPDSVELVEYELSDALKDQGVRPNVYPKLTDKAKQALNLYIEERERLARKAFLNELVEEIDNLDANDSVAMGAIRNVLSQLKELEG